MPVLPIRPPAPVEHKTKRTRSFTLDPEGREIDVVQTRVHAQGVLDMNQRTVSGRIPARINLPHEGAVCPAGDPGLRGHVTRYRRFLFAVERTVGADLENSRSVDRECHVLELVRTDVMERHVAIRGRKPAEYARNNQDGEQTQYEQLDTYDSFPHGRCFPSCQISSLAFAYV